MTANSVLTDCIEVDAYIAAAPVPAQPILRQLREVIKAAAPNATERISYGMPSYEARVKENEANEEKADRGSMRQAK
jgi:uncharacterized protein YdhG (YjbR/CyaY superfamily)